MTPAVTEGIYILLCFTGAALIMFVGAAIALTLWEDRNLGQKERALRKGCPVCNDPNHFWVVRLTDPLCTAHRQHYEHIERLEQNIYKSQ